MVAARHDFLVKSLLHVCKYLVNPNFDLETDYIFGKPMNRHFQQNIVPKEILSTFHAQIKYISVKKYVIQTNGGKTPKPPFA